MRTTVALVGIAIVLLAVGALGWAAPPATLPWETQTALLDDSRTLFLSISTCADGTPVAIVRATSKETTYQFYLSDTRWVAAVWVDPKEGDLPHRIVAGTLAGDRLHVTLSESYPTPRVPDPCAWLQRPI